MTRRLPTTVLSGFLGAGKTTLLDHIFHKHEAAEVGQAGIAQYDLVARKRVLYREAKI